MCRTMNELEKVIADYRSLKALKEELEEQVKDLEREIIGYMDANEKLPETGKDFTIKLSTCERRTVDTKRLEEDLGSLAEYQRISQYRRLYVKQGGEKSPSYQIRKRGQEHETLFFPDTEYIHL